MHIKHISKEDLARMLRNEFGVMNEAFYNLYAITGNPDHLKLAKLFYHGTRTRSGCAQLTQGIF